MKDEIREAMDAGYAQGVEATEKRAIKRIEGLESENAILRSELKLRQDVVEAAIRVRESGAGELPDYANQKSMDRWALGIKTLVELCDAVDRLRRAEDGEEK